MKFHIEINALPDDGDEAGRQSCAMGAVDIQNDPGDIAAILAATRRAIEAIFRGEFPRKP